MGKIIDIITGPLARYWAMAAMTLLTVALAYTGFWVYGASQVTQAVDQWAAERRAQGLTVRYVAGETTGYPLSIRLELGNPVLVGSAWDWQGENLVITAKPWRPGTVQIRLSGQQDISFVAAGQRRTFSGTAKTLAGETMFNAGRLEALRLTIAGLDLSATPAATGKIAIDAADLELRQLAVEPGAVLDTATVSLEITSTGIELPASLASPLGRRTKDLQLAARLLGRLSGEPGAPLTETLEIWRDGGGTVEIDQLRLSHGPLVLRADGTLALDRNLQPVGAFTARLQGFFETIDAFSRKGLIDARQAVSAKMLLGVFARRPKNGGPATLNLAVTVQQRELYAGPVKLLRLPLVQWR